MIHAHRGFRGEWPENTLISFQKAIEAGADFLELDVVISQDEQVVVSHEPWMRAGLCLQPDGKYITESGEKSFNLYALAYTEIKKFDCGSLQHPEFPRQQLYPSYKPLLSEVIQKCDQHCAELKLDQICFTIELKTEEKGDLLFHPQPQRFVELVLKTVHNAKIAHRCILQSFDLRILKELHKQEPGIPLSLLNENPHHTLKSLLNALEFLPNYYGPEHVLVNEDLCAELKKENIKLLPWTVNEVKDINRMIDCGVAGIISDYPDRVRMLIHKNH